MITRYQVKAARGLLDWTQEDLARRAHLDINQVRRFEGDKSQTIEILEALHAAFTAEGIVFTPDGVEKRNNAITTFEGNDWLLRLLDDVIFTLANDREAELLVECVDERKSTPELISHVRKMRAGGIKMRFLVEEDDTHLMAPLSEYRYIPRERFNNYNTLIYGDKFALCIANNTKAIVFKDSDLAETRRNIFCLLWDLLEQPETSTADERY